MEITVSEPWLSHIQKGRKDVEGRLNKGKFAECKVGSVLIISGTKRKKTVAVVTKVVKYGSFEEYLTQEGLSHTLPGVSTIREGVSIYRRFYSVEMEKEHGVLALHMVLASQ